MNLPPLDAPATADGRLSAPDDGSPEDRQALAGRFEQALALAARQRRPGAPDDSDEAGSASAGGSLAWAAAMPLPPSPPAAAAPRASALSASQFAAALERLHAPLPAAGSPVVWEFGLAAGHAPLAAVRAVAGEQGGWNLTLVAVPREREAVQPHLDRLRVRLAERRSTVASIALDDDEAGR